MAARCPGLTSIIRQTLKFASAFNVNKHGECVRFLYQIYTHLDMVIILSQNSTPFIL